MIVVKIHVSSCRYIDYSLWWWEGNVIPTTSLQKSSKESFETGAIQVREIWRNLNVLWKIFLKSWFWSHTSPNKVIAKRVASGKEEASCGDGLRIAHSHSALNRDNKNHFHPQAPNGGFLKWWYPTTSGFPTKNDHVGVFWGHHHFRKNPNSSNTSKNTHRNLTSPKWLKGHFMNWPSHLTEATVSPPRSFTYAGNPNHLNLVSFSNVSRMGDM